MSTADKIIAGLTTPERSLRSVMSKRTEPDEFTRLEREVERGRPLSGLARHFYEEEQARRGGESDEG